VEHRNAADGTAMAELAAVAHDSERGKRSGMAHGGVCHGWKSCAGKRNRRRSA